MTNKYNLIQSLDNLDIFDAEKYNALNIGINIDKVSDTNLLDGDWKSFVNECVVKLKDFNQTISVHGAAFDLNPGSPDKRVVELTKFRYKQCIYIANMINASFVVFHSQFNPWIRDQKVQDIKIDRQVDFWNELANEAGDKLTLLVENVYENNSSNLLSLIQKVNSPKVQVCFDTGHALLTSELEHWIKKLGEHIKLVHLHWNDRTYDAHQPPDEGALKYFNKLISDYNINPVIELEYKIEDIETEIKRVRTYLT
ncbi:MAG: sugar phosphate isomerase/epimerase [Ignavibacteriae bacterium]|nr:MAG: sugar phosphate isomerase/epimerase [Ignavibacteriota bacterium]